MYHYLAASTSGNQVSDSDCNLWIITGTTPHRLVNSKGKVNFSGTRGQFYM